MVAATRKFLVLCVALAAFGFLAPASVSGEAPASVPSSDLEKRLAAVIANDHHNLRLEAGLGSLGVRSEMAPYADANSLAMQTNATVGHSDITMLIQDFPTHDWASENALVMFNPAGDATGLWNESPGHHSNMMAPQATHMFISVRCGADGRMWITAQYVQDDISPRVVPEPVTEADRQLTCPLPDARFAPFDTAQAMVAQQYVDILGRQSDSAGLNYWSGMLESGQLSPARLVQLFLESAEHAASDQRSLRAQGTVVGGTVVGGTVVGDPGSPEVVTLYRALLSREPDAGGLAYWTSVMASENGDTTRVINAFIHSAEYAQRVVG